MVNYELYKIFYTVARCGSLTLAAEELHMSQPAVSYAIRQLEVQLGTNLFNRKHKGMELSASGGKLIVGEVEQAVKLLDGVEDILAQIRNTAAGTLRIGASDTIFQYVLAEKIVEYHTLYPHVKINLLSDVTPNIIDALKSDKCDIGFLNLPVAPDNGIVITDSIMYLNDIFIAGKAFGFLRGKSVSLRSLLGYPLLLMEEHTVAREAFENYAHNHGVDFKPAVEVTSWGLMKQLVISGMGIGCIPREYSLNKLENGSIFELSVTPQMPMRSVGMAVPRGGSRSYALKLFTDLFKAK